MLRHLPWLCICAALPAQAADFGPPRKVADVYNLAARATNSDDRLILRKCYGEPETACMFTGGGKVTVVASADGSSPRKTQLIAFAIDRGSDPRKFVNTILLAMMAWAPTEDIKELEAAYKVMIKTPIDDYREAQIKDVKYVLKLIAPGALAFTIKDAALP